MNVSPRATMPRAAKDAAKERIHSILLSEQYDNESFYTQENSQLNNSFVPEKFTGVAMKFLYLIKKMEICETINNKKKVFIDVLELCIENPEFVMECNKFKQILSNKMSDFELKIHKEDNTINEVKIDKKIMKLIKSVNDNLPNTFDRYKIISLLDNARLIHSRYTGPNSLNNKVLLAINSMRDTMIKYN